VGRLGLERDRAVLGDDQGVGGCLADEDHADVDGDLLALADHDQVDVLDEALDRVTLDLLRQRELRLPVDDDRQERVRVLEREHGVVAGQGDVDRVGTMAVQNGGNLVGATDATRGTLSELGSGLSVDLDLGHRGLLNRLLSKQQYVWLPGKEGPRRGQRPRRALGLNRVDHGAEFPVSLAEATAEV
jgi:hypothetical protein